MAINYDETDLKRKIKNHVEWHALPTDPRELEWKHRDILVQSITETLEPEAAADLMVDNLSVAGTRDEFKDAIIKMALPTIKEFYRELTHTE